MDQYNGKWPISTHFCVKTADNCNNSYLLTPKSPKLDITLRLLTQRPICAIESPYAKECANHWSMFFFFFSVFPLIVARVSNQDPDLNDVQPEEEDIITVFQFEHYFMDYCRSAYSGAHLYHNDKILYQTSW